MKQTSEHTGVAQAVGQPAFKKKKRKRQILVLVIVLLVLAAGLLALKFMAPGKETALLDLTDTTVLAYTDLEDSVSATGIVESAESMMVYSTNAYTVMEVSVEVGDYVEEGQLLAQLDDQNIQDQITSQELNMAASNRSSNQQIKTAQANYDNYKYALDNGLNSSLISARKQVDSTLEAYEKAQLTYDRYLAGLNLGENTTILNAESALRNAANSLETAVDSLESAEDAYDEAWDAYEEAEEELDEAEDDLYDLEEDWDDADDELDALIDERNALLAVPEAERTEEQTASISDLEIDIEAVEAELAAIEKKISALEAEITALESAYDKAESALDSAESKVESAERTLKNAEDSYASQLSSYNASLTSVDNTLADYATNVESTWKAYQDALVSLQSTEKSTQDQLQTYANSLASAKANANNDTSEESLRQLRADLEGTKITAPCAGTVTAVYAEVGSSGSGLLFVIEDVENLVVETSVKEYDIGTVQPGMKVRISSDATGDREIEGVISSIAPTSNKTSLGTTDTSGEAVFAAEVEITSADSGLRIGMETQLDYIIEEQSSVLAAPYDAVYVNEAGQTCVLTATEQDDGRYLIQEIEVTTGMDDDLDMVISGTQVTEGLRVINEPDTYLYLLGQSVLAGTGLNSQYMFPFPGGRQ